MKLSKKIINLQIFLLISFFLAFFSVNLHADIVFNNIIAGKTYAPQGASKANNSSQVNMIYFQLKNTGTAAVTLKSVQFSNISANVKFSPTGVKTVYWYPDSTGSQVFDPASTPYAQQAFTTTYGNTVTLTYANGITMDAVGGTNQTRGFFLVYDLANNAQVGATVNVSTISVLDASGTSYVPTSSLTVTANTATVTGLSVQTGTVINTGVVVPGDTNVPMFKLTLKLSGEDMVKDSFGLTIQNDGGNFCTTQGSEVGVTKVSLYWDKNNDGVTANYILLKSISDTSFTSNTKAVFAAPYLDDTFNFSQGVTENLIIYYDIGEDIQVTTGTTIKAQCTNFNGTGVSSSLPFFLTQSLPTTIASANVAGISYSGVGNIVPDTTFGPGISDVPILKFKLQAQNTDVTMNTVILHNTGKVGYITNPNRTDGITKISIYEDTNGNETYDGADYGDTKVGYLNLGYGAGQTAASASVTISYETPSHGYLLPKSTEKTFFVIYDLGVGINTSKDVSGNIQSKSNAYLANVYGLSSVSTQTLKLGGALPVTPSPVAEVSIISITAYIKSISELTSASAVQGQRKYPMLTMKVFCDSDVASSSFTIKNSQDTFYSNDTGITKVWMYRDENADTILDSGDTFLSSVTSFKSPREAIIENVRLINGDNNLLVYYDIGQVMSVSNKIGAQVYNISNPSSSLVFGGEKPQPRVPATLSVEEKYIKVNEITVDKTTITNTSDPFTVTVKISNVSTGDIEITTLSPRFYLSGENGEDISYQFSISSTQTFPFTLTSGSSKTVSYTVDPDKLTASGNVYVDGYVYYKITGTNYASVNRYLGDDGYWHLTNTKYKNITVSSTRKVYSWNISDYIDNIKVDYGGYKKDFQNYDAIPVSSSLYIYLKDQGKFLDRSQIEVTITPQGQTSFNIPTYEYYPDDGYIKVVDMGTTSGKLDLKISDLNANVLTSTTMYFYINSQVQVNGFLVYPNPGHINNTFYFGFNITQPANVKLYLFNALGQLVWSNEVDYDSIGYKEITWDGYSRGKFLSSGIYIAKIVAKDQNGHVAYSATKLAVY